MQEHKTLNEAKLAVMAEVAYIRKQYSRDLGYSFLSERDLIEHLRPAMIQHGITIAPVSVKVLASSDYTTKTGTQMHSLLTLHVFRFTHSPSGQSETIRVFGEAADRADKCAAKASTMAMKIALRQYFLIETGDDPDEVVEERYADNAEVFERAYKAIESASSKEALERYLARAMEPRYDWSEQQLEKLKHAANQRMLELMAAHGDHGQARK